MWQINGELEEILQSVLSSQGCPSRQAAPVYYLGDGIGSVTVWVEAEAPYEETKKLQWYFTIGEDSYTDSRSFASADEAKRAALDYAIPFFEGIVKDLKTVRGGG